MLTKHQTMSDAAMQQSIQSTFEQHQNEIKRRSEITQQGFQDAKTFERVKDSTKYDFVFPNQKFVVFSLSQQYFAPIPTNLDNPALCIYGAFPNKDEAVEYAHSVLKEHSGISIFVDETHKWIAATSGPEHMTDETYVNTHISKILDQHKQMLHMNAKEFQENVEKKQTGKSSKKSEEDSTVQESTIQGKSHTINSKLDVRNQKMAVVSFIKDSAKVPEFLFQVYAFFDKEEDANAYIRNVCGDHVQDFDIDVVNTCDWCFPQKMSYENANKEIFRSEELDKIMQNHRNQPKEVSRFEETLKDN